jgi:hypothetical protein
MRRLIVLAVVAALALLVVPAAFAGNGNRGGTCGGGSNGGNGQGGAKATTANYSLSGDVTAVDAENGVVTVTVAKANRAARAFVGKSVALKVSATTLFYERTTDGERVTATLSDIATGDRITSAGKLTKATSTFAARRITIALPVGTCLATS